MVFILILSSIQIFKTGNMETIKRHYENLVIGFGKGGKTLATYLAKHGKEVALIEQSDRMYGDCCINIACIPTKSLIISAANNTLK